MATAQSLVIKFEEKKTRSMPSTYTSLSLRDTEQSWTAVARQNTQQRGSRVCLAKRVQAYANTKVSPYIRGDAVALTQNIGFDTASNPPTRRLVKLRCPHMCDVSKRRRQVLCNGKPKRSPVWQRERMLNKTVKRILWSDPDMLTFLPILLRLTLFRRFSFRSQLQCAHCHGEPRRKLQQKKQCPRSQEAQEPSAWRFVECSVVL